MYLIIFKRHSMICSKLLSFVEKILSEEDLFE